MQVARPVGRGAAARKYDILSALMAFALAGDKHRQRQVMRLMALITTRYNWQRDELAIGQAEIARLWSVDERTVKREMAKFRALGWLRQRRPAARGRVAVYGIDLSRVMADTEGDWHRIGPDFVERLSGPEPAPEASNVVPLRRVAAPVADGSTWAAAQARLHGRDPASYAAWFHALTEAEREPGRLVLAAPTRFHASYVETHLAAPLLAALREVDPSIAAVSVVG